MKLYYVTPCYLDFDVEKEGVKCSLNYEIAIFNHIEKAHFYALCIKELSYYLIFEINNLGITGKLKPGVHKYFPLANHYLLHQTNIAPEYMEFIGDYVVDSSLKIDWFSYN